MIMIKRVTREVFETSDGRVFDDEASAKNHEEAMSEVKYFMVHYAPDLTEGRSTSTAKGLIAVCARSSHKQFAEHACYTLFGSKWNFVQGCFGDNALMPNWSISGESDNPDGNKIIATVQARFTKSKPWKLGVNKCEK